MTIAVPEELVSICRAILEEHKSDAEWSQLESDDMFQAGAVHGGYDATEQAFCFSHYGADQEWWFQITMEEVRQIAAGEKTELDVRPAS